MDKQLQAIEQQVGKKRNFDSPPLHLWHPPLSGDIPIQITTDGTWYHDGGKIERDSLFRLFASILRREEDGEYYLVTPGEKWRIEVELHPLMVTDVEAIEAGESTLLRATLNTGKQVDIGEQHPLFLEPAVGDIAALELDHGLTALFTRAAWYRLVEMAEDVDGVLCVLSAGSSYPLTLTV
jgi:hypothetical protein